MEDNKVKPAVAKAGAGAGAWANEFQQQHPESWAAEFTAGEVRFTFIISLIVFLMILIAKQQQFSSYGSES